MGARKVSKRPSKPAVTPDKSAWELERSKDLELVKRVLSPLLYLVKEENYGKRQRQPMAVVEPGYNMSSSNGPVSRLTELQARFQQKQLQEKEQKLLALYDEQARQAYQRIGPNCGKVRQLFQERRGHGHQAGWDRSYPLEPLVDNRRERGASLDRSNNSWKAPVRRAKSQVRKDDELPSSRSYEPLDQLVFQYNTPVFGDENDYLSQVNDLDSSRIFRKLPNIGGAPLSDSSDRFKTYIATKPVSSAPASQTMAPAKDQKPQTRITEVGAITKAMARMSPPSRKPEVKPVAPLITKQVRSTISPPTSAAKPRTNSVIPSVPKQIPRPTSNTNNSVSSEPTRITRNPPTKTMTPRTAAVPVKAPAAKNPVVPKPPAPGQVTCKICQRNFATDRIQAHSEICAKTSRKKRKPFDATKHRVRGTEMEAFQRKGKVQAPPPAPAKKKADWRKKHEDFINNIRAAKQAQAHLAKGGKLSDLPPPPPMDTSDLIPCPHCKRKFNQAAADRHIPKCANMLHNKPKPVAAAAKRTPARRY